MTRPRKKFWRAATVAMGGAAALLMVVAAIIAALFGASASCLDLPAASAAGPAPTGKAAKEIPPARLEWFVKAGQRFDISWPFLASIGVQECGGDGHCGVAPSGCAGVMEIAYVRGSECSPDPSVPTLWERFRVDADGGGAEIFDPADSIFTAARIFRESIGAPRAGGKYGGYFQAACSYYGACADASADYAHEVMARAIAFGFGHESQAAYAGGGTPPHHGGKTPSQKAGKGAKATHRLAALPNQGPSCGGSGSTSDGALGQEIVKVARSQLGVSESPAGSNCTKYGPCEEWCALFVAWVWQHAGIEMAGGTAPYAYSGSFYGWVREHGGRDLPASATPSPGDAVMYGTGVSGHRMAHVGIVESVLKDGEILTIEGNFADQVFEVGPFLPSLAVSEGHEPAKIYGYAEPPAAGSEVGGVASHAA
jgi:hypothetical protein